MCRNKTFRFRNNKKSAEAFAAADFFEKSGLYSWLIAIKSSADWNTCVAFMFDVSRTQASAAGFKGAVARSESRLSRSLMSVKILS